MAFDPVSGAVGLIGLGSSLFGNRGADSAAAEAARQQALLLARQSKWFDTLFRIAQNAEASGAFDPTQRLAANAAEVSDYEARDRGNLAGALRVAGYRPGDSEIATRQDALGIKYAKALSQQSDAIRRQSLFDKIQAFSAANPAALNAGIAAAGQNLAYANSQRSDPLGLVASILPFLGKSSTGAQPSGAVPTPGAGEGWNARGYAELAMPHRGGFDWLRLGSPLRRLLPVEGRSRL